MPLDPPEACLIYSMFDIIRHIDERPPRPAHFRARSSVRIASTVAGLRLVISLVRRASAARPPPLPPPHAGGGWGGGEPWAAEGSPPERAAARWPADVVANALR